MPLYNLQSFDDLPNNFTHWHDESIVVSGNSIGRFYSHIYPYYSDAEQYPAAINDSFKFSKLLKAGNYKINILGLSEGTQGILSLSVNGVNQFNDVDRFASSFQQNLHTRDIVIASDGMQEFVFSVNDKRPQSQGYYASLTKIWGHLI